MKIRFIETTRTYRGGGYRFEAPGEYEVDEMKAQLLLKDFPAWFEAVDSKKAADSKGAPAEPAEEGQNESDDGKSSINLSKANRAQLEAYAAEIGLDVTEDMDTNKKLKEAIEAKQEEA